MTAGSSSAVISPLVFAHSEVTGQSGMLLVVAHQWIHATATAPGILLGFASMVVLGIWYLFSRKRRAQQQES